MGEALRAFSGHVTSMDVDDDLLYTSSDDTIRIWDKASTECVRELGGLKKGTRLSVDARCIYCTSLYHFSVIDKDAYQQVYECQYGQDTRSDLGKPVNDDHFVYFPIRNGRLVIIAKQDFGRARVLQKHAGSIWGIDFDKDHLYTGSVDKSIMVWEKGEFEVVRVLTGHRSNVQKVCVSDKYLLSGSADLSAILWDKKSGEIVHRIRKAHKKAVNGLVFWGDSFLTSSMAEGKARVWELETGKMKRELDVSISSSGGVMIDKDLVYLALNNPPCVKIMPSSELFA